MNLKLFIIFAFMTFSGANEEGLPSEAQKILKENVERTRNLLKTTSEKVKMLQDQLKEIKEKKEKTEAEMDKHKSAADFFVGRPTGSYSYDDWSKHEDKWLSLAEQNVSLSLGINSLEKRIGAKAKDIENFFDALEKRIKQFERIKKNKNEGEYTEILIGANERKIDLVKLGQFANLLLGDLGRMSVKNELTKISIGEKIRETNIGKYIQELRAEILQESCSDALKCSRNGSIIYSGKRQKGKLYEPPPSRPPTNSILKD